MSVKDVLVKPREKNLNAIIINDLYKILGGEYKRPKQTQQLSMNSING